MKGWELACLTDHFNLCTSDCCLVAQTLHGPLHRVSKANSGYMCIVGCLAHLADSHFLKQLHVPKFSTANASGQRYDVLFV